MQYCTDENPHALDASNDGTEVERQIRRTLSDDNRITHINSLIIRFQKIIGKNPEPGDSFEKIIKEAAPYIKDYSSLELVNEEIKKFETLLKENLACFESDAANSYRIFSLKKKYLVFPFHAKSSKDATRISVEDAFQLLVQAATMNYPLAMCSLAHYILLGHVFEITEANIKWALECICYLNSERQSGNIAERKLIEELDIISSHWIENKLRIDFSSILKKTATDYNNIVSAIIKRLSETTKKEKSLQRIQLDITKLMSFDLKRSMNSSTSFMLDALGGPVNQNRQNNFQEMRLRKSQENDSSSFNLNELYVSNTQLSDEASQELEGSPDLFYVS